MADCGDSTRSLTLKTPWPSSRGFAILLDGLTLLKDLRFLIFANRPNAEQSLKLL